MLLKLRILFSIINVFNSILHRILLLIYKKSPTGIPPPTPIPHLPATKKNLFTRSAISLARMIRQREITCYQLMYAYIDRLKKVNIHLNAIIDTRFGDALIEAKRLDEKLNAGKFDIKTLEKEKPLYGVPFTVKGSIALKDCDFAVGSVARKGIKASKNADTVEALQNAGAIPVCVTNIPEMCCGFHTYNILFGTTCNPYDSRYSNSGSSGGEAALLGAGASVIGLGSDLAGSIRLPAFSNGVFGFKPTPGIVSTVGHIPTSDHEIWQSYSCLGPLTRYAEDLHLLLKVLTTKCDRPLHLNVPVNLKQLKIYYRQSLDDTFGMLPVKPEIKECVLKAAQHFQQYGNSVEELPIEWPDIIVEISIALLYNIKNLPQMLLHVKNPTVCLHKNAVVEVGKTLFGLSQHTLHTSFFIASHQRQFLFSKSDLQYYTKRAEEIREKLMNLLGHNGIFIYPTFRSSEVFPQLTILEALSVSYSSIFNEFGFPAVHVPMGLNCNGMPIGVQVIAAPYQDRLCLAVARELEAAFGGWVPPYEVSSE